MHAWLLLVMKQFFVHDSHIASQRKQDKPITMAAQHRKCQHNLADSTQLCRVEGEVYGPSFQITRQMRLTRMGGEPRGIPKRKMRVVLLTSSMCCRTTVLSDYGHTHQSSLSLCVCVCVCLSLSLSVSKLAVLGHVEYSVYSPYLAVLWLFFRDGPVWTSLFAVVSAPAEANIRLA